MALVSFPADPSRLAHVQENFVRHILPLRGFIFGLVPRRHLVDDIVQETFVTACQKADTYEPGSNFKAWIFAIARFKALAGCVAKLAEAARRAVVLRYSENLGPTEIAQRMGWSVNALNVALSRARTALRRCVEETVRSGKPC